MAMSKWLTRKEVADVIRISVVKLDRMRLEGSAPPEMKIGRAVRFAEGDFELWLQQQSATRAANGSRGSKSVYRREERKKSLRHSKELDGRASPKVRRSSAGRNFTARKMVR